MFNINIFTLVMILIAIPIIVFLGYNIYKFIKKLFVVMKKLCKDMINW